MVLTVIPDLLAAGGNRHSAAADWAPGVLAFGAGSNIAISDPDAASPRGQAISALLPAHAAAVHAVRLYRGRHGLLLVSAAADGGVLVWRRHRLDAPFELALNLGDDRPAAAVHTLAALPEADLLVSGAADGTLSVWRVVEAADDNASIDVRRTQTITLQPRYLPLACALTLLDDGAVVLAVAGTTSSIQLFVRAPHDDLFQLQATLSGHEGWIRSLDFTRDSSSACGDILLASASQDKYIRLWRFGKGVDNRSDGGVEPPPAGAKSALSNKTQQVGSVDSKYAVTFEALLIGHEDWIYTARWSPANRDGSSPTLLSASADNSLSIWRADESSGLWVCHTRLGEISSQKGSTTATGSTGGFWIGLWQPDGQSVISLGRTGSWRKWDHDAASDSWRQTLAPTGHTDDVRSIAWAPDGSYLLSTSADQTTRVFAEWKDGADHSWHEFARPQIHGYDLNCIDALSKNQFISGADEKLLRVFDKPRAIDELMSRLCGTDTTLNSAQPDAANIPVLGLSNKAIAAVPDDQPAEAVAHGEADRREAVDPASVVHKSTLQLSHPPLEEHLSRHTLWPEAEKLYGHGYEICAVSASHDGRLAATACRATALEHAVIRLYESADWREVRPALAAHTLTVTALAFSPDDRLLLSVGRDRQWAVFARSTDPAAHPHAFTLLASDPKGHSRMILDCAWAPLALGRVFATAGRDKTVKLWCLAGGRLGDGDSDAVVSGDCRAACVGSLAAAAPVTALAFAPDVCADRAWLAYGTELGAIEIVGLALPDLAVTAAVSVDRAIAPRGAVNALRWRPRGAAWAEEEEGQEGKQDARAQLAVGSEDASVRIYNVVRS